MIKRCAFGLAALAFSAMPAAAQYHGQIAPVPSRPAAPAQQPVPGYITAKPDAITQAFGPAVAQKIFSDAYTPVRQQAIVRSQQSVPGFQCPADPQIALPVIVPYPTKPGAVSWIERYIVACNPRTVRNFLMMLEGEQPRFMELVPGQTNADPLLQRDVLQGAAAATAMVRPKDCDKTFITDTQVTQPRDNAGVWVERWSYDLCGKKAQTDMTFTPSERGGTTWSAKIVP
jgi:hypothetical protein